MTQKINTHIEAPEFLKGRALEIWDDIAPELAALGIFQETDVFCLVVYCDLAAEWLTLAANENKDESVFCQISDLVLKYSDALGLNPAARAKMGI